MAQRYVNMTDQDALFKEFYGEAGTSVVNKKTPFTTLLMKNRKADWVGDNFVQPVRFGSGVGLGYRSEGQNLPVSSPAPRNKAVFPAKSAYATAEYSRQAIIASRNDRGAFAKVTVDEAEATVEGFMLHNLERVLFGDSSGKIGEVASKTGTGTDADPWLITMATTGTNGPKYKKKYFPKGARMDLYTPGGVYQMTVKVVAVSSTVVSAITISTGAQTSPTATDVFYWEGNRNQEAVGLKNVCPASAGTLYGISQSTNPEFAGGYKDLSGATVSIEDLNLYTGAVEDECGESPTIAFCSTNTFSLFKNQTEDQKRYPVVDVKGKDVSIGFKGIEIVTSDGTMNLVPSQMCAEDDIWLCNEKHMQLVLREDFGWFDDDGRVLLRDPNKDIYNARYGGYFEFFCSKPNSFYRITNFLNA